MPEKDSNFGKLYDSTGHSVVKYWPIISALVIASVSVGGIYVKLDYIAKAIDRTDNQFQVINSRQDLTTQSVIEMRGQIGTINEINLRNVQNINDLSRRVDSIQDKVRWAPK